MERSESPSSRQGRGLRFKSVDVLLWMALGLLGLHLCAGIWPIAPIEPDGLAIANGAVLLARGWVGADSEMLYRFSPQAGTYAVTAWLVRWLDLSGMAALTLVSLAGGAAFLLAGVGLVKHVSRCAWPSAVAVMLLFQETFTSLYYPNSVNAAAGLGVAGALLYLAGPRGWAFFAGALMGAGAWMRADAGLLLVVVLASTGAPAWRAHARRIVEAVLGAGLVYMALVGSCGGSVRAVLAEFARHADQYAGEGDLMVWEVGSLVSFFTGLLVVLMGSGLVGLLRERRFRALALCAAGIVPTAAVYSTGLVSPKYLYCTVPFFAVLVASGLEGCGRLSGWRKGAAWAVLAALFLGQYVFGICYGDERWARDPHPQIARIMTRPFGKNARVVLGAGTALSTCAGLRLSSGIFFAPLMWRESKEVSKAAVNRICAEVESFEDDEVVLLSRTWTGNKIAEHALLRLGFSLQGCAYQDTLGVNEYLWTRAGGRARLLRDVPVRSIDDLAAFMATARLRHGLFIYGGGGGDFLVGTGERGELRWEAVCEGSHILKLRALRVSRAAH